MVDKAISKIATLNKDNAKLRNAIRRCCGEIFLKSANNFVISRPKTADILMICRTETVDLLPPDEHLLLFLSVKTVFSDRAP